MRIVSVTCIKNEIDIAEAFVRHALGVVDQMIVLDTGSTDGTRDVLASLRAAGLPVDVRDDGDPDYLQARRMTAMMVDAVERHRADWVMPLDADEFPRPFDRARLEASVGDGVTGTPRQMRWETYVPTPTDHATEPNPVRRITHRLVAESRPWSKVFVPKRVAARGDVELRTGSHCVTIGGIADYGAELPELSLAHFPIRSPEQYVCKVIMGYLGFATTAGISPGLGVQYHEPFEVLRRDPSALVARFYADAENFAVTDRASFTPRLVDDPFPYLGAKLTCTPAHGGWSRVIQTVVGIATAYAFKAAGARSDVAAT